MSHVEEIKYQNLRLKYGCDNSTGSIYPVMPYCFRCVVFIARVLAKCFDTHQNN